MLAAKAWRDNAEMLAEIAAFGYIRPDDKVIDLTFGDGNWWTDYRHPGWFVANVGNLTFLPDVNEHPHVKAWIGRDFRNLEAPDLPSFDVVLFDPPYVSMGGRDTSQLHDFMRRYGLKDAPRTPELLHEHNAAGLVEARRICKPGGLIMVKCADYISSNRYKEAAGWMRDEALKLGLVIETKLTHVGNVRMQPSTKKCKACKGSGVEVAQLTHQDGTPYAVDEPITDVGGATVVPCAGCDGTGKVPRKKNHPRNNCSVLWVFRRPKRERKQ